jgi:competence protein ComEC
MSRSWIFLTAFLAIAAVFGFWRYQTVEYKALEDAAAITVYAGENVRFAAKVVKAPEDRFDSMRVVVEPEFVERGRVLLVSDQKLDVRYADRVQVRGILEQPSSFDGFDYAKFLAKDSIYALVRDPSVEITQSRVYENAGERIMAAIFDLKVVFRNTLQEHLSPRHSSVMVEMLLGDKDVMSDQLAENLNVTGLRHIIAISGAHIAILTMYLMPLFIWLGLWRQQAFYVTVGLIAFYVVLTGLQPSAVRSGIMGGMFLLGQHVGRQNASLRALLFSATGMLLINPLLLLHDVGFQLSFLAVLGMIFLMGPILSVLPQKLLFRQLLAMTFAAQIFTLPIVIWNFGQISAVSVITNLLVVPIMPVLMGLGFVLMIGGTLLSPLGFLFSFPVALLVQYIVWVVDFFAALPFAAVRTENLSVFWLALFYAGVGLFCWKFRKRKEFDFMP